MSKEGTPFLSFNRWIIEPFCGFDPGTGIEMR